MNYTPEIAMDKICYAHHPENVICGKPSLFVHWHVGRGGNLEILLPDGEILPIAPPRTYFTLCMEHERAFRKNRPSEPLGELIVEYAANRAREMGLK